MEISELEQAGYAAWYDYNNYLIDLVIKSATHRDKLSIDVGCHRGRFTTLMAKSSKLVYAFDPDVIFLEKRKNAEMRQSLTWIPSNFDENIIFINCGLSDRREVLKYVEYDRPSWNSFIDESFKRKLPLKKLKDRKAMVMTLDDFIQDCDVSLIKIDAEGYDYRVLKGGEKLIKRALPIIIIELTNDNIKNNVINFLSPLGYRLYNLSYKLDPTLSVDVDNRPTLNVVCVPSKDHQWLSDFCQIQNRFVDLYHSMDNYEPTVVIDWLKHHFQSFS